MVTLKLLYILLLSCIAISSSAIDGEIPDRLISFVNKQDSMRDFENNAEDSKGSSAKQKRNALKSILNGILIKERLATERLLNSGNLHTSQIQIPNLDSSSAAQVTPYKVIYNTDDNINPIYISVPHKSLPLCEPSTQGILIKNEATILPCIAPNSRGSLYTNYPSPLNTVIQQNVQLIPLTTSTNFKLPSTPLTSNDYVHNYILPPNEPIPPLHTDSIMQRNISQIPPCAQKIKPACDSPSNDNIDLSHTESDAPLCPESYTSPSIKDEQPTIPEAPALLPLNPPIAAFYPTYSPAYEEEGNDIQVVYPAHSESSDCPPSVSEEINEPVAIPEAPALQPLNLNSEEPCPQTNEDEPPSFDSSIVIPNPPAYIPLNPPDSNNLPGYALPDVSDNSESSNPLPCSESMESKPIAVPEAPVLLPLNPPNSPIYPPDYSSDKEDNGLYDSPPCSQFSSPIVVPPENEAYNETPLNIIDSTNVIPNPPSYFPLNPSDSFLPTNTVDENIQPDNFEPCHEITNSYEPVEDTPIITNIPEAPALMPLNPPDVPTYLTDRDNEEEVNIDTNELSDFPPCPEPSTSTPAPLDFKDTIKEIPNPPSYFPLNPPDVPIFINDEDIRDQFLEDDKTPSEFPCPQTNPQSIEETTPLPLIPYPPSYIPLNPPDSSINAIPNNDEKHKGETPCLEPSTLKAEPIEDLAKYTPTPLIPSTTEIPVPLPYNEDNNKRYVCSVDPGNTELIPCPQPTISNVLGPIKSPIGILLQQQLTIPTTLHNPQVYLLPEKQKVRLTDVVIPNLSEYEEELPLCNPETSADGVKAVLFESRRCRKHIKVAIPASELQPIRKRKIVLKKSPISKIRSSRPILIKKLKKGVILRKEN